MRTCPWLGAICSNDSSNPCAARGIVETEERLGARGSGPIPRSCRRAGLASGEGVSRRAREFIVAFTNSREVCPQS